MFAVKRALELNNNEATLMAKHAGFRRAVFNFGLARATRMQLRISNFYHFKRRKSLGKFHSVLMQNVCPCSNQKNL